MSSNCINNLLSSQKVVSSAADYVVLSDDVIINISDTSITRIVTLPAPSVSNEGKYFVVKDSSGSADEIGGIDVISAGGASVDGSPSHIIDTNFGSVVVYSDGSNYFSQSGVVLDSLASFSARKSSPQVIAPASFVPITLYTSVDFNNTTSFDAASGAFTAPRSGRYFFNAGATFSSLTGAAGTEGSFQINGSVQRNGVFIDSSAFFTPTLSSSAFFSLGVGDTVTFTLFQNSGVPQNTVATDRLNYFEGFEVIDNA